MRLQLCNGGSFSGCCADCGGAAPIAIAIVVFAAAGDKAIAQRVVVMIVTMSMNDECSGMNRERRRMNDA